MGITKLSGIKQAREKANLSIDELANLLKVESSVIRNWENGIGPIHINTVKKISKLLNVPTELILLNENRPPLDISNLDEKQKAVVMDAYKLLKKQ